MASFQAVIARKGVALDRLAAGRERLKGITGVEYSEAPVTNRDPELARVQEMENTAEFLEKLADALESGEVETPKAEQGGDTAELTLKVQEALAAAEIPADETLAKVSDEDLKAAGLKAAQIKNVRAVFGDYEPAE